MGSRGPKVYSAPERERSPTMKRPFLSLFAALSILTAGAIAYAQDQLTVTEIVLGSTLDRGVPTPAATSFHRASGPIFCMARISNPGRTATAVHIGFERAAGEPSARVGGNRLEIPAQPRYRTVGRTGSSLAAGTYRCVVRAEDGTVLNHANFKITK
jgi:hypothetical protein